MKSVGVQLYWCIFFEQVASLGNISSPAPHVKQVLLLAPWQKGTPSLSAWFSRKKSGTFCLVVGRSVNTKLSLGKSLALLTAKSTSYGKEPTTFLDTS